ncbi:MAG: hypothetical protein KKA07_01325 [Bacteroidetes bacterium]|nr:hypothetical protein [Bacteroidota bacterium]MBU1717690.1 hypothetical protein [Bacteroidota bacterium]
MTELNIHDIFSPELANTPGMGALLNNLSQRFPYSSAIAFLYLKSLPGKLDTDNLQQLTVSLPSRKKLFFEQNPLPVIKGQKNNTAQRFQAQLPIIERFIETDPSIIPNQPEESDMDDDWQSYDDDEICSETIAEILANQKQFSKSIEMYKKLCLKYPGKSSYFAAQIEKIEKQINP